MIKIQREDFNLGEEAKALHDKSVGAIVSFTGLVRDMCSNGTVSAIELEHFPGMTEKSLAAIEAEARQRWPLLGVTIIHRIGRLEAGEQIVLVVVSAPHRQAAFEAASFLMDFLKTRAPFWKKEWVNDQPQWVEAKASDQAAAERWQTE